MLKRILMLLLSTALLLVSIAGCSGDDTRQIGGIMPGQSEPAPQISGGAPGQSESAPQTDGSANRDTALPSRNDFPYMITHERYTCEILGDEGDGASLLRDGDGVLHAFYRNGKMLCHKTLEGSVWSKEEVIFEFGNFPLLQTALSPEGKPCVACPKEDKFHVLRKVDGKWEESVYDPEYRKAGLKLINYDFMFAMDAQGAPLFLYMRGVDSRNPEYYLNDLQLTRPGKIEYTNERGNRKVIDSGEGIIQGLSGSIINPKLTVSPDGALFLDYISFVDIYQTDRSYKVDSETFYIKEEMYSYNFSKSTDGGKTWSGPYSLCGDGLYRKSSIDVCQTAYAENGAKYVFIPGDEYDLVSEHPQITITEVSPSGEIKVSKYFSYDEISQKMLLDKRYLDIFQLFFRRGTHTVVAPDGTPYIFGPSTTSRILHLDKNGVWHITVLDSIENVGYIEGIILDENGELALYGQSAGQRALAYWKKR